MKKYLISCLLVISAFGCVPAEVKEKVAYQAARLDRAVALIDTGVPTKKELEDFIRGERKLWHALDFSLNNTPLPPDCSPLEKTK